MGSVETLYDGKGKVRGYLARWRDEDDQGRKKTFLLKDGLRKKDAEKHAEDEERKKRIPEPPPTPEDLWDRTVTVAELAGESITLRVPQLAENTILCMRSRWRNHIVPTQLGRTPAFDVQWTQVQTWANEMREGNSKGAVEACLGLIRRGMEIAVRDKRIPSSPAAHRIYIAGDEPPEDDQADAIVVLEVPEVACILAHLEGVMRLIATIQAHTGARVHEVLGLLKSDIDLKQRAIRFRKQAKSRTPGARAKLKTGASRRDVVIGAVLAGELESWLADHPGDGWLCLLDGEAVKYDQYKPALEKAARDAALEMEAAQRERVARGEEDSGWELSRLARLDELGEIRSHAFRHHHASVLIGMNVPLLAIARRLGHSTIGQIEKTYGHLMKVVDEAVRDAVDGAWRGHVAQRALSVPSALPQVP